jgi:hypothetical protein
MIINTKMLDVGGFTKSDNKLIVFKNNDSVLTTDVCLVVILKIKHYLVSLTVAETNECLFQKLNLFKTKNMSMNFTTVTYQAFCEDPQKVQYNIFYNVVQQRLSIMMTLSNYIENEV